MNILILGGTKFIGPRIVNLLVANQHKVCLFHRGKTNYLFSFEVQHILGDRSQLKDYTKEFQGFNPDVVIDLYIKY